MKKISIIYHSGSGHTEVVAKNVLQGVSSIEGIEAHFLKINGEDIKEGRWKNEGIMEILSSSDGIIFGCPTYMGSASAQFKAFIDATSSVWMKMGWKNKFAGGFTNSGSMSGDKLNTLIQLAVLAAQHGMIWVGAGELPGNNWSGGSNEDINRLGSNLGLMTQSNVDQPAEIVPPINDQKTAQIFGTRFAEIVKRFN
jgi:multimeric flavodoxin WrbA